MNHILRDGILVRAGGLLLLLFLLAAVPVWADLYDNIDPDVNGAVTVVAVQQDGKILIGGSFTGVNGVGRNRIARLNADGSLDLTFNPGTGADNDVGAITVQGSKILIGGHFTSINGIARNYIARLNRDGSVDTGFDPGDGADGPVYAIAARGNTITLAGQFTALNGISRNHIGRLSYDGSVDTSFDPGSGTDFDISALALHADGTIVIGGSFTSYNGIPRNRVARLSKDGRLDTSFGSSGGGLNGTVLALAEQVDGSIVVGGVFTSFNTTPRNHIARLTRDGRLDTTFTPGTGAGGGNVNALAIQPDGRIVIGGWFTRFNGLSSNKIARLNFNGTLDTLFRVRIGITGTNYSIRALTVLPDSRIFIGGHFTVVGGKARNHIAHILPNGWLDERFDPGSGFSVGSISAIVVQLDGSILVGGDFTSYQGVSSNRIVRLSANGSRSTTFGSGSSGANETIETIAIQADNRILIGGWFTYFDGTSRNRIARLNFNGSLDTGFDPGSGANGVVTSLILQPDGRILIGGSFTSFDGTTRNHIARLNGDGSVDTGFNPGSGTNSPVTALAIQPDGKILIGGLFTSVNGVARNHIARLNANGSLDTTFDPGTGTNGEVYAIVVRTSTLNDKILLAGNFTAFNGTLRNRIVRLNANGSLDTAFNPGDGANATIETMALLANGKIFLGGAFTTFNSVVRNHIARLNYDGSLDMTFFPGAGTNDDVTALAVQPDGRILLGGRFTSIYGLARNRIARISPKEAVLRWLEVDVNSVDGTRASWYYGGPGPDLNRTTLELSADGLIWTPLAVSGSGGAGKWRFGPLQLPFRSLGYLRARGYSSRGSGLEAESIVQFFLTTKKHKFYIIRSPSGRGAVIAL